MKTKKEIEEMIEKLTKDMYHAGLQREQERATRIYERICALEWVLTKRGKS
jgi:excinuclease UvrABC nuclease subunit